MEHRGECHGKLPAGVGCASLLTESPVGWHDCRVIDISTMLGITLHCLGPSGRRAGGLP